MADESAKLRLVLCWHMHQPMYRDLGHCEFALPWTYLHAIKDYTDMAAHLEAVPGAKAVVNFAPVLLEQIEDYVQQIAAFLQRDRALGDPLLAALGGTDLPATPQPRRALIENCLKVNRDTVIRRFPAFAHLERLARTMLGEPDADDAVYLSDQFVYDLLTWYHLGWMGESIRREDALIQRLQDKGRGFDAEDRRALLARIHDLMAALVGRYRKLAEMGRIELSMTPYAHPIMPLLLDLDSAREAMPNIDMGSNAAYPGGEQRVHWQIEEGIATFRHYFGVAPRGCWPSEGGVSNATLSLLAAHGFRWTASGERVLRNSLSDADQVCLHRVYGVETDTNADAIRCFFRDDGLSDLIGFQYAKWDPDDAVTDLVRHLENIAEACADPDRTVASIILDGENAWEYYPENGYRFLRELYTRLADHPSIRLSTFGECVDAAQPYTPLPDITAGSWVYGTFSTWIGDPDKNRAWEMLIELKQQFDRVRAEQHPGGSRRHAAERQLAVCEGSDWFWWFGDYNPEAAVSDFDLLYRRNLANAYRLLGVDPPSYLAERFAHGSCATPATGGTMRTGQPIHAPQD